MGKGYNKIIVLQTILLLFLLFNSFVFKIANMYTMSALLVIFLILSIAFFGFEKENYRGKKDVLLNIIINLLIYYFITYVLGLFTGFIKTSYSLNIINVIKNIFPVILLIVISELLRYEIFTKSKGNFASLIIGFIIFVLVDINVSIHLYDVTSYLGLTKMICLVVFPSISKNILLIYLAQKVGYSNAIIYRLLTDLSAYILPLFPDFGEYLNVLLKTALPIIIMVRINSMFNYYEDRKVKTSRYNNKKLILYSFITIVLFVVVILTSGMFTYQALTIGSSSMSPKIEKGDIIILKKVKTSEIKSIEKGDILVYNQDNKIIVHRVVDILMVDGKYRFITKGDNNNTKDAWMIKEKDIIGIVKLRIKYLGMPTVALNELLNK